MRHDMHKVLTERPRHGSRNKSRKYRGRVPEDHDGPSFVSSGRRRQYKDWREFTDLIGPLERYLNKQVGRPWDKIWSEISETLDLRSMHGQHIRQHIEWIVERHCWLEDGRPVAIRSYAGHYHVSGLFVHPRTGLLSRARRRREATSDAPPPNTLPVDTTHRHECIGGIWYLVRFRTCDPDEILHYRIIEEGRKRYWSRDRPRVELSEVVFVRRDEGGFYYRLILEDGRQARAEAVTRGAAGMLTEVISKRQLGKKELRNLRRRLRGES